MHKLILAAAGAALTLSSPAAAQSAQEKLDARYDRALAAGYKALFLCSAIANAERNGATRTPESVLEWELTGIQSPLDEIVGELPYQIHRIPENNPGIGPQVRAVAVDWAGDTPPRYAIHNSQRGCRVHPVGSALPKFSAVRGLASAPKQRDEVVYEVATFHRLQEVVGGSFSIDGEYGEGARTSAVVVQRNGATLDEEYAVGFGENAPQRTWSVAKSIAATLVGAAVYRGQADVNASAELGADETDPRRAITIDHALRMASGRYTDTPGNRTDALYYGGATVAESMTHWPLIHAPGTVYRYANNDTLAATQAIKHTFTDNPPAEFFAKVGMHDTVAETDWQGDYILSSQVWSTARDLATLGQLMLNDGVTASGERVLPEGWVEYVTTPSGPQPDGPLGYGAGWWLVNNSEGIPPDTYAALGNRGQILVVVPSRDVVIVRRGEDPAGTRFDFVSFTRDVLAALEN